MGKYYKAATPDKLGRGSFGNRGQKPGMKKTVRKEKATDHVTKRLRNISRGLFHTKQGNPMKAQENA